jgi:alanine-synthesizing transaminase
MFAPRKAVMHYTQEKNIAGVTIDDIYLGNGASELIVMAMQGLLNNGDEVLVPAPDYPLWTAAVSLSGGNPVHYVCDEQAGWMPDIADMRKKITPNTRAIVVINPEQPDRRAVFARAAAGDHRTGAPARLIIYADEIYDKTLYDGESTSRWPRWPTTCCSSP